MSRLNIELGAALHQLEKLANATEIQVAIASPANDLQDQQLLSMAATFSVSLEHLSIVAERRGGTRKNAYALYATGVVLALTAYGSNRAIPDGHVFSKTAMELLSFLQGLTPREGEDELDALARLSINCDNHTGALARSLKVHVDRLIDVRKEEVE